MTTRDDVAREIAMTEDASSISRTCAAIACKLMLSTSLATERIMLSHALDLMREALATRVAMDRRGIA